MRPSRRRALDCMIVGAQKCGTTSLKEYLSAHPGVATHLRIEFPFFGRKQYSETRVKAELDKLLSTADGRLTLAKDAGMYTEPFGLDRLKEVNPDCKLILTLRDPVARAHSAFRMYSRMGNMDTRYSFADVITRAIAAEREGRPDPMAATLLYMGCYGRWLGEILRRFPYDNIKVIFLEEFRANSVAAYEDLCVWCALDPSFSPDLTVRHHVGGEPRSTVVARAVKGLRSERNPVKRAARLLLPELTYVRLTEALRRTNRTSGGEESGSTAEVDDEVDYQLRQYFQKDGNELSRLLGRNLPWDAARSATSR